MGNPKRKFLFYTKLEISLHFGPTSSFEYLNIFDTLLLPKRFDSFSEVFPRSVEVGLELVFLFLLPPPFGRLRPAVFLMPKRQKRRGWAGATAAATTSSRRKEKKGYIATARRGGPSRTTRAAAETQHPQRRTERERRKDLLRWNRLLLSAVCSFLLYSYYYYYYDWIKETAVRAGGCITQSGRPRFFSPPFLGPRYEPFFRSAISFSCLIWLFFFFMSPVNGIKSAMEKPLKPVIDSQWNENKNFFLSFFAAAHPEPRKEMGLFWVSVGQSVRRPSCIILVTRFFSFWERRVGVADADGAQKPTAEDTPSEITQRSSSSSFL